MERVAIVGSSGAGKSTLSRRLGQVTGLPVVHLDHHFWSPGWVEMPKEQWRERVTELAAGDRWIIEGNYGGTADLRLARADTIVKLEFPRTTCLWRALRRDWTNRGTCQQAPGCPEQFSPQFIRYIWRFPKEASVRMDGHIAEHGSHSRVVRLGSDDQVEAFRREAAEP